MADIQHKIGDTFVLDCIWKVGGVTKDLTGYTILSQIRDTTGALILEFDVIVKNQTTSKGRYQLRALPADQTDAYPGVFDCDIQYTSNGGGVESTQTFSIEFIKDVSAVVTP